MTPFYLKSGWSAPQPVVDPPPPPPFRPDVPSRRRRHQRLWRLLAVEPLRTSQRPKPRAICPSDFTRWAGSKCRYFLPVGPSVSALVKSTCCSPVASVTTAACWLNTSCSTPNTSSRDLPSVRSTRLSRISKRKRPVESLPDAERREDAVQDVVGGGRAGDGVDGPQRGVEIEQQHLVRDVAAAAPRAFSRYPSDSRRELLVAQAGDEAGFLFAPRAGRDRSKDRFAQAVDPLAGQRRDRLRIAPRSRLRAAGRTCCPHRTAALRVRALDQLAILLPRPAPKGRSRPASDRHPPWPGNCARCRAFPPAPAPSRMPAVSNSFTGMPSNGGDFGNHVARGAGNVGDDGAVLFQQAVEQAALADVGPADDGQRQAVAHQPAVSEARGQASMPAAIGLEPAQDLGRRAPR